MGASQSVVFYESPKQEKWNGTANCQAGAAMSAGSQGGMMGGSVGCFDCVNRRRMKVDKEIEKERDEQLDMYIYAKASAEDAVPASDLDDLAPASPLASSESHPVNHDDDSTAALDALHTAEDGFSEGNGPADPASEDSGFVSRKTSRQEHEVENDTACGVEGAEGAAAALGSKKARRSVKFDGDGAEGEYSSGLPANDDDDVAVVMDGSPSSMVGLRSNSSLNRKSTPFPFAAGSRKRDSKRIGSRISIGYDDEDFDIDERFPLTDAEGLTDNIITMEFGESEFGDDDGVDDDGADRAMRLNSSSSFGSFKNRKLTPFPRQLLKSRQEKNSFIKEEKDNDDCEMEDSAESNEKTGYDAIESILFKVTGGSFSERVGDVNVPSGMHAIEEEEEAPPAQAPTMGPKSFTRNFTSLKSMASSVSSGGSWRSPTSPTAPSP